MVEHLVKCLKDYKVQMDYKNVDLEHENNSLFVPDLNKMLAKKMQSCYPIFQTL